MSSEQDYIKAEKFFEKEVDAETREEIPVDEFNISYKDSTNWEIIERLLYLSVPLIFMYITHIFWATLIYYNISSAPLFITEGKSILFLYYYTILIGIIWGFSIGFEIRGSRAYGARDTKEIYLLLSSNVSFYLYFVIFLIVISNTIVPYVIGLFPFYEGSVANFKSEILLLSVTFPLIAIVCILGRLSNMLQRNHILNYATLYALITQIIGSYLFMNYLQLDSYGMGLTFICTYIVKTGVILRDFLIEIPQGIDIRKIQIMKINSEIIIDNFYFALFPALNGVAVMISSEVNSYVALSLGDVEFTIFSVYFNIFSLITNLYEAIANSTTILASYAVGKRDNDLAWKIWYQALKIIFPSSLVISVLINIFAGKVFLLYSTDEVFLEEAYKNSNLFSVVIFLGAFHHILTDFIMLAGFGSYPFKVNLVLKFGLQFCGSLILIKFFGFKSSGILYMWIITQLLSILIYSFKLYSIKKEGIHVKVKSS